MNFEEEFVSSKIELRIRRDTRKTVHWWWPKKEEG